MLKTLYARLVLWLIQPAIKLQGDRLAQAAGFTDQEARDAEILAKAELAAQSALQVQRRDQLLRS